MSKDFVVSADGHILEPTDPGRPHAGGRAGADPGWHPGRRPRLPAACAIVW